MGHSNSLKDIPNTKVGEFEKFLVDNGIDTSTINNDFTNTSEDDLNKSKEDKPEPDQPKKESIGKILFKMVDIWCMKNPGLSLAIVLGGSTFICYKMTVAMLSQAVFKGNLKTSRYFAKHAG